MNWDNYLLEQKSPVANYAHLGVFKGAVRGIFDLSTIPTDTKILEMSTPLKKFKLTYTNLSSLNGNKNIEAIILGEIDDERVNVFSTLPNLKYLHISVNKQNEIPDLSPLKNLQVLVLSSIKKVENIDFLKGLTNLKTLYIHEINNLYDLEPLSSLTNLEELFLDHGKMSGTGQSVKSMEPISRLNNLKYLAFILNVEKKNYDITPLLSLKKLQKLHILPRYLDNGNRGKLLNGLPLITEL
ncbi:leucine-rich repeat domain-containing protein [Chryseobacterium zhengzhouense]|uniref:Leucine-rich repeat domain-containing protein n=1 Tax=Chryseobacterium zhengzhouense TaxID=1636086 RepID=A0ABW2M2M0_9FLAO